MSYEYESCICESELSHLHGSFHSAYSIELAGFFKREKGLQSLKAEKRLRQKSCSDPQDYK